MNDIRLCYFRLRKPVSARCFFRYRVKNLNPYNDTAKLIGEVRYAIISDFKNYVGYNEKMFAYSDKKENCIYTYQEIKHIPDLSEKEAKLEFADEIKIPVVENPDLYSEFIEYRIYRNIFRLNKYDCHEEHNFYLDIKNTPANNLNITMRRKFEIKTKVMPDGTAYIGINLSTEYFTPSTIYDYMRQGRNVIGMDVKCLWQDYNNTGTIIEVPDRNINETDDKGFNVYNYWENKNPKKLVGIDPDNTKVIKIHFPYNKKHPNGDFVPQSLVPVFRRETIASSDSRFSRESDKLMKLPMRERLQIILEFIKDLNSLTNDIVDIEPVKAVDMGYSVYNARKNMPLFEIGNNRKIKSEKKYSTFTDGFYRLPEELCIRFMYFEEKINECRQATRVIIEYLTKGMVNGVKDPWLKTPLLPAVFLKPSYPYRQNYDELMLKETALEISRSKRTNFVICFVPMENDDEDSRYEIFKKVFADINMPSQMISASFLDKIRIGKEKDIKSCLQNIALGILCKSGGIPWIMSRPFSDVDCFVGIDVAMQSKGIHYPACSVCLDGNGNLIGYYTPKKAQPGEKINAKTLTEIFDNVLIAYRDRNGRYPKHIVIHRDGFSNESDEWYEEYFSGKSINYDIVEVKKNISERLLDMQNNNGMNPDSSVSVIKDNEAIIVTTQRYASYGGAPKPIEIVHKYGNLSMEEIVTQIYTLSELHVGAVKDTRLPVTTYYADKICKAGEYIPRGEVYN
ncbi:MAG: hypothetical protein K2G36_10720, partial [Ruminococcus sp.]|nr:hypothetical protein [Ruminococcus sp.]